MYFRIWIYWYDKIIEENSDEPCVPLVYERCWSKQRSLTEKCFDKTDCTEECPILGGIRLESVGFCICINN